MEINRSKDYKADDGIEDLYEKAKKAAEDIKDELSEATIDLDYTSGQNDNIMSLRKGREYRNKFDIKNK